MSQLDSDQYPKAQPHDQIEKIIDNVWYVTGSVVFKPLVRLPRNMVIIRHQGELTLINSVRLDEAGEKALDALGKVCHIIKIGGHGMDDAYYLNRYKAKHWVVGASEAKQQRGIQRIEEGIELPFPDARVFEFKDTLHPESAIILDQQEGLLITCDSVQHWVPSRLMSFAAKIITRIAGFQKPAQIGPKWRVKQTAPGKSLRADFDRLAENTFELIIGGHGGLLTSKGNELLKATIKREL